MRRDVKLCRFGELRVVSKSEDFGSSLIALRVFA
jgi:hypothetical protein